MSLSDDRIIQEQMNQELVDAYDALFQELSEEDVEESNKRIAPPIKDFAKDVYGREISYEKSVVRKPANCQLPYTKEHIEELMYCHKHSIYMIKNYFKIINQEKGLMNFELYDYQAEFIKTAWKEKRMLVKFPRQSGKCFSSIISITYLKKPQKFVKKILYKLILKFFPSLLKDVKLIGD